MNPPAGDIELETLGEVTEELVQYLHAFEPAEDLDELREDLTAAYVEAVVVARRGGEVVGWGRLIDPEDDDNLLIAHPVVHDGQSDAYRAVVGAAFAAAQSAGHPGIRWIVQDPDCERVAGEMGADPAQDLGQLWRADLRHEQAVPPAGLAGVEELPAPPTSETLARYAQLYTEAGITRCDDNGCTTSWNPTTVVDALADRDEFLDVTFSLGYLDHAGKLLAEVSSGIISDTATLSVVQAHAMPDQLAAVLAATLDRLRRDHPDVSYAEILTNPDDTDLPKALETVGFTVAEHAVEYRLTAKP